MIYFNIVNKRGRLEPWTGGFKTEEEAKKWYNLYGKRQESEGKKLVKVIK